MARQFAFFVIVPRLLFKISSFVFACMPHPSFIDCRIFNKENFTSYQYFPFLIFFIEEDMSLSSVVLLVKCQGSINK